jgi:hypothetical protein
MPYFLILILLFVTPTCAFSQILNIDRENGQDSVQKKFKGSFIFNFSGDKQRRNVIEFNNTSEMAYFLKKQTVLVFVGHTDLILNGTSLLENNGFFQMRFRDNDTRKLYPDIFAQYQWNGIQGMEYRGLGGGNLRMRWLEKKRSDLYTSIGFFYENEKWNPNLKSFAYKANMSSLDIIHRELFRLNLSAKFALKLGKKVDFSGSSFIQFPINSYFGSPRWFFDSNLNFEVNKYLSFIAHYDHNLDNYRPLPIENYYYNLSLGFQLKF